MSAEQLRSDEREQLREEVYHIVESTNDDETVNVEITGWEKVESDYNDAQVDVEFLDTWMNTRTERMEWPSKDSDEYKFVRLCHEAGLDFNACLNIDGSTVKADPENWELIAPKQKPTNEVVIETVKQFPVKSILVNVLVLGFISLFLFAGIEVFFL